MLPIVYNGIVKSSSNVIGIPLNCSKESRVLGRVEMKEHNKNDNFAGRFTCKDMKCD